MVSWNLLATSNHNTVADSGGCTGAAGNPALPRIACALLAMFVAADEMRLAHGCGQAEHATHGHYSESNWEKPTSMVKLWIVVLLLCDCLFDFGILAAIHVAVGFAEVSTSLLIFVDHDYES